MKYIIDVPEDRVNNGKLSLFAEVESPLSTRIQTGIKCEPYTEPDRKAIEDDVWELADYMCKMSTTERTLCFAFEYPSEVTTNFTFQEAKALFEKWMKSENEIHVGDEVMPSDTEFDTMIVTRIWKDDYDHACVDTIGYDGRIYCFLENRVLKTGRHFPEVAELLEKMRGEEE